MVQIWTILLWRATGLSFYVNCGPNKQYLFLNGWDVPLTALRRPLLPVRPTGSCVPRPVVASVDPSALCPLKPIGAVARWEWKSMSQNRTSVLPFSSPQHTPPFRSFVELRFFSNELPIDPRLFIFIKVFFCFKFDYVGRFSFSCGHEHLDHVHTYQIGCSFVFLSSGWPTAEWRRISGADPIPTDAVADRAFSKGPYPRAILPSSSLAANPMPFL